MSLGAKGCNNGLTLLTYHQMPPPSLGRKLSAPILRTQSQSPKRAQTQVAAATVSAAPVAMQSSGGDDPNPSVAAPVAAAATPREHDVNIAPPARVSSNLSQSSHSSAAAPPGKVLVKRRKGSSHNHHESAPPPSSTSPFAARDQSHAEFFRNDGGCEAEEPRPTPKGSLALQPVFGSAPTPAVAAAAATPQATPRETVIEAVPFTLNPAVPTSRSNSALATPTPAPVPTVAPPLSTTAPPPPPPPPPMLSGKAGSQTTTPRNAAQPKRNPEFEIDATPVPNPNEIKSRVEKLQEELRQRMKAEESQWTPKASILFGDVTKEAAGTAKASQTRKGEEIVTERNSGVDFSNINTWTDRVVPAVEAAPVEPSHHHGLQRPSDAKQPQDGAKSANSPSKYTVVSEQFSSPTATKQFHTAVPDASHRAHVPAAPVFVSLEFEGVSCHLFHKLSEKAQQAVLSDLGRCIFDAVRGPVSKVDFVKLEHVYSADDPLHRATVEGTIRNIKTVNDRRLAIALLTSYCRSPSSGFAAALSTCPIATDGGANVALRRLFINDVDVALSSQLSPYQGVPFEVFRVTAMQNCDSTSQQPLPPGALTTSQQEPVFSSAAVFEARQRKGISTPSPQLDYVKDVTPARYPERSIYHHCTTPAVPTARSVPAGGSLFTDVSSFQGTSDTSLGVVKYRTRRYEKL